MYLLSRYVLRLLLRQLALAVGVLWLALLVSTGPRLLQPFQSLPVFAPQWGPLVGYLSLSALSTLLPLAFLLGGLLTCAQLARTQTLRVMEGLGPHPVQLWRPLGALTLLLSLLLLPLALEVEPVARQHARRLALELEAQALAQPLSPGDRRQLGSEVWLQALTPPAPQPLLLLTDARDPNAPVQILATQLRVEPIPTSQGLRLHFTHGEVRQLSTSTPHTPHYTLTSFETLSLTLPLLTPGLAREVTELTQPELHRRIQETLEQGKHAVFEQLTLWRRWTSPLLGLGAGLWILPLARWGLGGKTRALQAWGLALSLLLIQAMLMRLTEGLAHQYPAGLVMWALSPGLLLVVGGILGMREVLHHGLLGAREVRRAPTRSETPPSHHNPIPPAEKP